MKPRYKLAIAFCLLLLIGGNVAFFALREPELVRKARTLRKGMTVEQVKAVLGEPIFDRLPASGKVEVGSPLTLIYECEAGRDVRRLFTREPPFLHPVDYWNLRMCEMRVSFMKSAPGVPWLLTEAWYNNYYRLNSAEWEIDLRNVSIPIP